jgi:hypothetical protein
MTRRRPASPQLQGLCAIGGGGVHLVRLRKSSQPQTTDAGCTAVEILLVERFDGKESETVAVEAMARMVTFVYFHVHLRSRPARFLAAADNGRPRRSITCG